MNNSLTKTADNILTWGMALLVGLIPLSFLPLTTNFYAFNKNFLLYLAVTLFFLAWAAKIATKREISLVGTPLDLPLALLGLAFVLATLFASANKIEPLAMPEATGTVVALIALYFLITNNLRVTNSRFLVWALMVSAGILGLLAVYQFIGLGQAFAPAEWMKPKTWTPAGGSLPLVTFLVMIGTLALLSFLEEASKSVMAAVAFGLITVLAALGLMVTVFQILPGKESALIILPYTSSWAIAIEAFKQSPLLGVGPGNFVTAFNRFRPVGFNQYDFWNARFGASSSYLLHLLTVSGLLGLLAYLFLVLRVVRSIARQPRFLPQTETAGSPDSLSPGPVSILVALLLQFFLPVNFLSLFTFFVLLALFVPKKEARALSVNKNLALVPLAGAGLLAAAIFYFGGRAYAAEVNFKRSLDAFAQNRGADVYNLQIKAINLNPWIANYRLAYSQTNFALANVLASKSQLTDQDRATITQLIQQAIREAKVATVLNPTDAAGWENLAQIYRNLINFAQGADQWAIAAYRQTIITDPINPRIRLNLGGLFYALKQYDAAIRQFQNAVDLKPDFANGYYNLAAVFKEKKMYPEAYQAMQAVVNLVPADSADFQRAKNELDELAEKLPAEATPSARPAERPEEALTEPQPLPSPVISPPISLPEEAAPEIPQPETPEEVSPTPQTSPTPETPL